jgi:DNA uptake protein ComE-like DNA-binding protein
VKTRLKTALRPKGIKASLFQKLISFLIWGGLILLVGILQSRYHRKTYVTAPISLFSGEDVSANKTQFKGPKSLNASENAPTQTVELNYLDSLYLTSVHGESLQSDKPNKKEIYHIQLNLVDSATLESLPGIGAYTAKKIISYRNRLGGYISKFQLWEIPYVDSQLVFNENIQWEVDTHSLNKISLIELNISQLYKHPYLGKTKAKNIMAYHNVHGPLNRAKFESMRSLSVPERQKLLPYLKFASPE